jgi:hypothetical protein
VTRFENAVFSERLKELGDTAETAFEKWARKGNIPFVRMGFNRPPFKRFYKVDERLRLMPDYICEGDDVVFVEVKGCGNEGLKIKLDSLDVMGFWNDDFHKVKVFVYNSATKMCAITSYEELADITEDKDIHEFPDKKKYYIVSVDELDNVGWEKLE